MIKFCLLVLCIVSIRSQELDTGELFRWNFLEFQDAPREPTYQIKGNDYYINTNNIPTGITPTQNRLFVSIARKNYGIPSTLNYIDLRTVRDNKRPLLRSFPDYKTNELNQDLKADPLRITSVYRTRVDECSRLWFVDTGVFEANDGPVIVQPPSIWIMNLRTDKLIRRFEIPATFANDSSGLQSITIDADRLRCDDAYAYIPNSKSLQILVYSFKSDEMWSFKDATMNLNADQSSINYSNKTFSLKDGIYSIALGARNAIERSRKVYYHPLASINEYYVLNKVLKSKELSLRSDNEIDFAYIGTRGPLTQAGMHDYDTRTKVLFFTQLQSDGLLCWNTDLPLTLTNTAKVAANPLLISQADLKVERGFVWYLTNNMHMIGDSILDISHPNFFIFKQTARSMIDNTICKDGFVSGSNDEIDEDIKDDETTTEQITDSETKEVLVEKSEEKIELKTKINESNVKTLEMVPTVEEIKEKPAEITETHDAKEIVKE